MLRTIDGGATWKQQDAHTTKPLRAVRTWDRLNVTVCGDGGTRVCSDDGGADWSLEAPWNCDLNGMADFGRSEAWAVGDGGVIVHHVIASGVASVEWSLDGGSWNAGTHLAVATDGDHVVQYRGTDVAGNVETANVCRAKVDTVPPVTVVHGASELWGSSVVMVSFTASDAGSGVAYTETSLDGGPWLRGALYLSPSNGDRAISYRSTDNAGNVETTQVCHVRTDTLAPTTGVTGNDDLWHATPVTLAFAAIDNPGGSGVDFIEYAVDDGIEAGTWTKGDTLTLSANGAHTVAYRATDKAGNVEIDKTCTVKIGTVTPETSVTGADSLWHSATVTLLFSATDAGGPGIDHTEYRVDGGAWTTGTAVGIPAPPATVFDHIIDYRSVDTTAVIEIYKTCHVKIDTIAPAATIDGNDALWHNHPVVLAIVGTDNGSGVDKGQYKIDGAASWTDGSAPVVAAPADGSNDGSHTVTYRVVDAAGNASSSGSVTVKIDATAPVSTLEPGEGNCFDGQWYSGSWLSGYVDATDAFSGVARIEYSVDFGEWLPQDYETGMTVAEEGVHRVDYRSVDNAGNVEVPLTCWGRLDNTPPEITMTGDVSGAWRSSSAHLHATCLDSGSGVDPLSFQAWVDGADLYTNDFWVNDEGDQDIWFTAYDTAGNLGSAEVHVRIHKSPPTTVYDTTTGKLVGSDPLSGVSYTEYCFNKEAWTDTQASGTTQNLRGIACVDALHAWAFGPAGTIRRTTDGGSTWTSQSSGTTNELRQPWFVNATTGWATGYSGTILRTTDAGSHWTAQQSGVTNNLEAACFTDVNTGWVVGSAGKILHTTDAGAHWTTQASGPNVILDGIGFADANNGWVVGFNGVILHTTNGGATWVTQASGTTNRLVGVAIDHNTTTVVTLTGGTHTVLSTIDGGTTWSNFSSAWSGNLYGAAYANHTLWVAGAEATGTPPTGHVWCSTDGGHSVRSDIGYSLPGGLFYGIALDPTGQTGWAVGDAGHITHTGLATAHWDMGDHPPVLPGYSMAFSSTDRVFNHELLKYYDFPAGP